MNETKNTSYKYKCRYCTKPLKVGTIAYDITFSIEKGYYINTGFKVCLSCKNLRTITCLHCKKRITTENTKYVYSNNDNADSVCFICKSEYLDSLDSYKECYQCNAVMLDDYNLVQSFDDEYYCQTCYNDNFCSCSYCGSDMWNDDVYYCDNCETDFCQDCNSNPDAHPCNNTNEENDEAEPRVIDTDYATTTHNIHTGKDEIIYKEYKTKRKGKYLTDTRLVGIELEAENGNKKDLQAILPKMCNLTRDGSLQDGVEIQTPPSNLSKAEKIIKDSCKALTASKYEATGRCGLHIHLDARTLKNSPSKLVNIFKTYYILDDIIFAMLPESRRTNHYCQSLLEGYTFKSFTNKKKFKTDDVKKFWYKKEKLGNETQEKYDSTRYSGLNLHSVFYRGTLEIRYHSGTTNPIKIFYWIKLMQKFVNYAVKNYDNEKMNKLYKQKDFTEKLNLFFDTFNIDNNLQSYVIQRIKKFNKNVPLTIARKENGKSKLYKRVAEIEKSFIEGKIKKATAKRYITSMLKKLNESNGSIDNIITKDEIRGIATEASEIAESGVI